MKKKKTVLFKVSTWKKSKSSRYVRIGRHAKSNTYLIECGRKVKGKELKQKMLLSGITFELFYSCLSKYIKDKNCAVFTLNYDKDLSDIPPGAKSEMRKFTFNTRSKKIK